jgi:hypothetical protein
MNTEYWRASLNPSSPRYIEWRNIFSSDDIPLVSPFPMKAKLGPEDPQFIYLLNWHEIVGDESDRLIAFVVERFKVSPLEAASRIEQDGVFPIRQADVIVSFSPRAFL